MGPWLAAGALWTVASVGSAAVPEGVVPVAAPEGVQEAYAAWLASSGAPPGKLACDPVWAGRVHVCFQREHDGVRSWVTEAEAQEWGVDVSGLRAAIAAHAGDALTQGLSRVAVPDMPGAAYWQLSGKWAASGLLRPEELTRLTGAASVRVAAPRADVLLVWPGGDEALDTVMAVGVREIFDAADGLTPAVFAYSAQGWAPGFEARPASSPGAQ